METNRIRRYVLLTIISIFLISAWSAHAKKFSLSTNLLGYTELGTLNIGASYAVARRWSVIAGIRYNPLHSSPVLPTSSNTDSNHIRSEPGYGPGISGLDGGSPGR